MKTNFDLGFSSALVLRTPAYSFAEYGSGAELPLHDLYFRTAIMIASPVLYRQLEKKEFNPALLNEKEKQTVLKYWNRACFRPTPFGLFAGVSCVNWGSEETIKLATGKKLHTLLSYEQSIVLADQWLETLDEQQLYYTINSSLYLVGKEYRHLQIQKEDKTGNKEFIINAVEKSKALQAVLTFLKVKRNKKALQQFVKTKLEVSDSESRDYVAQLIEEQIITSVWLPNITGEDYLQRLSKAGLNSEFKNLLPDTPIGFTKRITQGDIAESLKKLLEGYDTASQLTAKSPFYIITERPVLEGSLSDKFRNQISAAIQCSALLNKKIKSESLDTFVKAFIRKYDQQWVPLMKALDPEIGVGYLSLGINHRRSILLEGIEFTPPGKKQFSLEWTTAHQLLMNKMVHQNSHQQTAIQINAQDLLSLHSQEEAMILPPSFSVMFRLAGNQVYLEQAGGTSALALIGRFTPVSEDIYRLAKEVADHEQSTNPDVVFAELIYIAEKHTANIDRREVIYPYEIPVTDTSIQPDDKQITLSDLWITVMGEEIILWSQRLSKRIIPRLSSAYNYQRSSLSVFRFLGDLQHQGLHSRLNLDLSVMFPGIDYYPRVEFQNTILSLEMWRLSKEQLNAIKFFQNEAAQHEALIMLCRELALPDMITINEHDHQLAVNINEPAGIQLLLELVKTSKELLLKEFPFIKAPSVVNGENQKPFANQFIAALYNNQQVYKTELNHYPEISKTPRNFMPGSKWLYFKIYCHPYRSNQLLTSYLLPCIHALGKHIKQYFFIRYQDNGYHIRLRLLVDPSKEAPVIQVFRKKLDPLLNEGIISGISTEVYVRELERYTTEIIDQVEDFFCASSVLIITHLFSEPDPESLDYYRMAVSSIELMMDCFNLSLENKERFCNFHYQSFAKEFGVKSTAVQQFKLKYRKLKGAGLFSESTMSGYLLQQHLAKSYQEFNVAIKRLNLATAHWHLSQKNQLLSNLIHMHLNRLFVENPREQELIIHYCLSAWYHGEIGRKKQY